MARLLHDPAVRDGITARLRRLDPGATRRWGAMSVDQMLWHCNESLRIALGQRDAIPSPPALLLPVGVVKFLALNFPWPKGTPTATQLVAAGRHQFEEERTVCLRLIDEFTARSVGGSGWGMSPSLGPLTGREWSQLHARHLDHHLRQFGA